MPSFTQYLFDLINTGNEVDAHGRKWVVIRVLTIGGLALAIEAEQKLPCTVQLIRLSEKESELVNG
jgi:hypothetical protein